MNGVSCACGKTHSHTIKSIVSNSGAIACLPDTIRDLNGSLPFIISDATTEAVAGQKVKKILKDAGYYFSSYIIPSERPEPNEQSCGAVMMHYDPACDIVIAVGSGVINDLGKLLAAVTKKPYIIVATAPSMDGYASATSSMARDGVKVSIPTKCADAIIGDTDILREAPMDMLRAGLGDMLAKYVSIAEWRISNIINGEYYCEEIASLVRKALRTCVENADGLLKREETAVKAVFDGLVATGVAMTYAGLSRPASGVEHYISHIWDMRGLEFGTKTELHGIQCAIGTHIACRVYDRLKTVFPDREKALDYVAAFDYEQWKKALTKLLGKSADTLIKLELKEGKYNKEKHKKRLSVILDRWDELQKIMRDEIPSGRQIEELLLKIGAPTRPSDVGIAEDDLPDVFCATRDIRDKYVLSRLIWDLGLTDSIVPNFR